MNLVRMMFLALALGAWIGPARGGQSTRPAAKTELAGQIELARLVDLSAERLGYKVEYDAAAIKGTVTLRLGEGLSDEDLWSLANRVLASRGFATVRLPGAGPTMLSVVKLTDAPGLAKVEEGAAEAGAGGYATVVQRIEHVPPKAVIDALKQVLSKPGGSATDLGVRGWILISDLRPRIDEATRIVDLVDQPGEAPAVRRIETKHVSAAQLVPALTAASAARDAMAAEPRKGKVQASPDGDAFILVCPPTEVEGWLALAAEMDQRAPLAVVSYTPRHFAVADVGRLIEATMRGTSSGDEGGGADADGRGSGDRWRLVVDELTGTLTITATVQEHDRIAALVKRLDETPSEARRPLRSFVIRNRSVRELVEVLGHLLDVGDFAGDDAGSTSPVGATGASTPVAAAAPGGHASPSPQASSTGSGAKPATGNGGAGSPSASSSVSSNRGGSAASRARVGGGKAGEPPIVLTADEATNTLIAVGEARMLSQLEDLIRRLDVRQPQVMVDVFVVSLSDSETLDLGAELRKIEVAGNTTISLSSLFGLSSIGTGSGDSGNGNGSGASEPEARGRGFTGIALSPGDFSVVIRALQTINHGRTLTFPKVLVNNNQQATLDSVLKQPYLSTNASDTVATTTFGGSEDAGTVITVKPQIAPGDFLIVEYSITLSSFVGEAIDPTLPPPKQSNTLSSVVTVPDGYTVVVGGLETTSDAKGVSQIPLLGSIPLIGEAFKNRSNSNGRSRFFVFIRPDVMRHGGFEDLKHLSAQDLDAAGVDDGWPTSAPRVMR